MDLPHVYVFISIRKIYYTFYPLLIFCYYIRLCMNNLKHEFETWKSIKLCYKTQNTSSQVFFFFIPYFKTTINLADSCFKYMYIVCCFIYIMARAEINICYAKQFPQRKISNKIQKDIFLSISTIYEFTRMRWKDLDLVANFVENLHHAIN